MMVVFKLNKLVINYLLVGFRDIDMLVIFTKSLFILKIKMKNFIVWVLVYIFNMFIIVFLVIIFNFIGVVIGFILDNGVFDYSMI